MANEEKTSAQLQEEITKRKAWFFECQLRRLYMEAFRGVEAGSSDTVLLDLISEPAPPSPSLGTTAPDPGRVYIDSGQQVWTKEERDRRDAFKDISTGSYGNWLNYGDATKLAEKLAGIKSLYEDSKYQSAWDQVEELNKFYRQTPLVNSDPDLAKAIGIDRDALPHAISRTAIAETKPWLIPELFNDCSTPPEIMAWIKNGEAFISNFENELTDDSAAAKLSKETVNQNNPESYRTFIKAVIENWLDPQKSTGSNIGVQFFDRSKKTWIFDVKLFTFKCQGFVSVKDYPHSHSVKYWTDAWIGKLREVYVNKSESDMGLCLVMRTLYLYGTLNSSSFVDKDIRWRKRSEQLKTYTAPFNSFFDEKTALIDKLNEKEDKEDWKIRLTRVKNKLMVLLQETAAAPRIASACFSPLAQGIMKLAILKYKFWLDEPYHFLDDPTEGVHAGLNKARKDFDTGEPLTEMEYWSENHYIMFASSEYLAGQLWPEDTFQPAADILVLKDIGSLGIQTGAERMERGKARVLKWLNNKLMFGWTEFNSSGYYREHLWALLNLVDFALDDEIAKKATTVTDLLLFDVTRFSHKGSMSACGGRSQFPSKNSGWDNALGDAIEIILGARGVFTLKGGEIGCSFATSTYTVPAVLLQIANYPPEDFHIDRSRVSIGFDEAPKYGIDYSQRSDQRDSLFEGYAPKRAKHYDFLAAVNANITSTHHNYGAWHDDTMFWWSQSAFFNKQVVKNTFQCVSQFKLDKCKAFASLQTAFTIIASLIKAKDVVGLVVGGFSVSVPFFWDDATAHYLETGGDDLSMFFEGSTRSRVNIYTVRNKDISLSSIQNFRTGQTNFQSVVNQATINNGVSVFTTAGFPGISLSDIPFALGGLAAGGLAGSIVNTALFAGTGGIITAASAVFGAGAGVFVNRKYLDGAQIGEQGDGVGWWTGSFALPMVVQHERAAIIMYDFHWIQRRLTDVGSHVWFPKKGFFQTKEMRSSGYDDSNTVITDFSLDLKEFPTFGYDVRGYWLFGQKIQHPDPLDPEKNEEAYIGVFSNRSPDWQDQQSDFYSDQLAAFKDAKLGGIRDTIDSLNNKLPDANARDKAAMIEEIRKLYAEEKNFLYTWPDPLPTDFFAEKDWYAQGKNIWILQVGNKKEYGSFENFKEKVSSARVVIDDSSDMECAYHIPQPDGSTQVLSVKYKDEIKLDGNDFQADFYPRFENKFVRGNRVEWGQREYVIEYRNEKLLHDFSNMNVTIRSEWEASSPNDVQSIKGLVIYLRTTKEEMEVFTVATATVVIGCDAVATDEVIAAGKVAENNFHDAEWIYFNSIALPSAYMTIDIAHHTMAGKGADDTEWTMTFTLMALMGDRTLKPCTVSTVPSASFYFRDKSRTTGAVPFSVTLLQWRSWQVLSTGHKLNVSLFAGQARDNHYYFDHTDQFGIDASNILSHRTIGPCNVVSPWTELNRWQNQGEPAIEAPYRLFAYSTQPGYCFLFAISGSVLYARWLTPAQSWSAQPWQQLNITCPSEALLPDGSPDPAPAPVPVWPLSFIYMTLTNAGTVEPTVYVSGMDGNIYTSSKWPLNGPKHWRKIETTPVFALLHTISFQVTGNFLFALDTSRSVWKYPVTTVPSFLTGTWEPLPVPAFIINSFITAAADDVIVIVAVSFDGSIWSLIVNNGSEQWQRVGENIHFNALPGSQVSYATATKGRVDLFATGTDQKLYTTWWTALNGWEKDHNWALISPDSQQLKISTDGNIAVLSRIDGQIEVYATDENNITWINWWS